MTEPARRVRRTPEEAKRLILETARALVARTGPQGLRLQDIAAEAGISHPLILHHFGSRAGLVRALTQEAAAELRDRLLQSMTQPEYSIGAQLDQVFDAFRGGLAQRLAWLLVEGPDGGAANNALILREIADTLHTRRVAAAAPGSEIAQLPRHRMADPPGCRRGLWRGDLRRPIAAQRRDRGGRRERPRVPRLVRRADPGARTRARTILGLCPRPLPAVLGFEP